MRNILLVVVVVVLIAISFIFMSNKKGDANETPKVTPVLLNDTVNADENATVSTDMHGNTTANGVAISSTSSSAEGGGMAGSH